MEDWQKDLWEMVETATVELEKFFQDVGEAVEAVADEVGEAVEAVADELQDLISTEIEEYWEALFEPITFDIHFESEEIFFEDVGDETDFFNTGKVHPTSEKYPACVGCNHYHGQIYGENLLVCAMHPYGWDDKDCPDWEGDSHNSSDFDDQIF